MTLNKHRRAKSSKPALRDLRCADLARPPRPHLLAHAFRARSSKPGLSTTVNPLSSQAMHRDHQYWYSHRLNRDMGVAIYGNYGAPILAFPTSCGDEWEMEGQGMIRTLSPYLEQGRIRIFCINSVNSDSFQNKGAHPFHRSWMQAQYDAYVANEVFPFIDSQCQTPGIGIAALGASLGAYHAANTLFKHPDHVKRCYALSGIYDMRDSMNGMYDDNFYFNNPVDYMANQSDPWYFHQYASCDIRLVTGCGPWENSGPTYRMSEILRNRGIAHHLDDWGPEGGHEWPYWHHQMWEYVGAHY
jgi:esterase/lipase superfamily enzyme